MTEGVLITVKVKYTESEKLDKLAKCYGGILIDEGKIFLLFKVKKVYSFAHDLQKQEFIKEFSEIFGNSVNIC